MNTAPTVSPCLNMRSPWVSQTLPTAGRAQAQEEEATGTWLRGRS